MDELIDGLRRTNPLLLAKVYLDNPSAERELEGWLGRMGHELDDLVAAIKRLPKDMVFITAKMDKLGPLDPANRLKLSSRGVAAWAIEQYLIETINN